MRQNFRKRLSTLPSVFVVILSGLPIMLSAIVAIYVVKTYRANQAISFLSEYHSKEMMKSRLAIRSAYDDAVNREYKKIEQRLEEMPAALPLDVSVKKAIKVHRNEIIAGSIKEKGVDYHFVTEFFDSVYECVNSGGCDKSIIYKLWKDEACEHLFRVFPYCDSFIKKEIGETESHNRQHGVGMRCLAMFSEPKAWFSWFSESEECEAISCADAASKIGKCRD